MPEINAIVRTPHGFLENCFLERFGVFSGEFTVGDDRVELLRGERVELILNAPTPLSNLKYGSVRFISS